MTRPAPAPRMRIVPEVATEEMVVATVHRDVRGSFYRRGVRDMYVELLDAAPSAGCVSRELVDWAEERAGDAIWNALEDRREKDRPGVERCEADNETARAVSDMLVARVTAAVIAALGLTVAPAADTAREREGG